MLKPPSVATPEGSKRLVGSRAELVWSGKVPKNQLFAETILKHEAVTRLKSPGITVVYSILLASFLKPSPVKIPVEHHQSI